MCVDLNGNMPSYMKKPAAMRVTKTVKNLTYQLAVCLQPLKEQGLAAEIDRK